MSTSTRRLFQNAGAMVVLAVLQRGMGLITIFFLARILDVRGLGAYAFTHSTSQTFYGLVRLGADVGLHVSLAKLQLPENKLRVERLLGEALVLFLSIAVVAAGGLIFLAQPIATTLFAAPELAPLVALSAVLLAAQVVSQYCYTVFAGLSAFVVYARLTWVTSLLTLTLAVLGGVLFGTVGAVWGTATGGALTAFALAVWLSRELASRDITPRPRLPSKATLTLLTLGLPFYFSGLLLIPADFLCIGYLSRIEGVGALGELRAVQTLMSAATVLPTALSGPLLSRLAFKIDEACGVNEILVQLRAIWVLSLTLTIGLATLWPVLVDAIFGVEFWVARSAGVLALLNLTPMILVSVPNGAFLASRRSVTLLAISVLQVLLICGSAQPLIANFGLGGYLAVQALHMSVGTVAAMLVLRRQFEESFFGLWMLPLGALTFVISVLIVCDVAIDEALSTRLAVGVGMMALLVATCIAFVFTASERARIAAGVTEALCRWRARGLPAPTAPSERK